MNFPILGTGLLNLAYKFLKVNKLNSSVFYGIDLILENVMEYRHLGK